MKTTRIALSLALATLFAGCAADETDAIDGTFSQPLSSEEEYGVLQFVNDCPTSLPVLDDDASLDVRAAEGIVSRRDGADETCGTGDDVFFESMKQLDDVPWVGNSALTRLITHATLLGYIGEGTGDGLAEDYDGVAFTMDEAKGVLAIANGASFEILDDDLGLDRRAATAIVDNRPFIADTVGAAMQALADARYVGATALSRLKGYVQPWSACANPAGTLRGTDYSSLRAHDALDMLNQAPIDVLKAFTGIGTVIADRINYARPFENLDQVANVDGVGPAVARNIHGELDEVWCPLLGARCGCPAEATYRLPYVAFDENGLYYFLGYLRAWGQAERVVESGFLSHDGDNVVLDGVEIADDPDGWQDIMVDVFDRLWDCCLSYQYFGEPLELGANRRGTLHIGRVINAHDDKQYVMAHWNDIDDASFGWLYEKDANGAWARAGQVFLN